MIKLDLTIEMDGKKGNVIETLDPFFVEAIGIETIAARAADKLWIKLKEGKYDGIYRKTR